MEKRKQFSEKMLCAALLIGVGLGAIGGMAIYAFAYPIFQSKEWAAWVQAFGTIGAVIGAFAIVERQAKLSMNQAKELEESVSDRKQESYKAVVKVAFEYTQSTYEFIEKKPPSFAIRAYWRTMGDEDTHSAVQAVMAIPLHDLGHAQLIIAANGIRSALTHMRAHVENFVVTTEADPNAYPAIQDSVELQAKLASHHWSEYEKACAS